MDGFEERLIKFVNKTLPATKEKEPLIKLLPWVMIVLNTLGILLLLTQALNDFDEYAAFYVVRILFAALMIYGGFLMKKLSLLGWRLAFYSLLVSLVINIIALNILGLFFHCFFAYAFIQVRECYSSSQSSNPNSPQSP